MKQRAVLHDAIRNEPFGYAVKDGNQITYFGSNNHANEWAAWANRTSLKSEDVVLPDGVIIGPFANVSEYVVDQLTSDSHNPILTPVLAKDYRLAVSGPVNNASKVPAVVDTPIHLFKYDQYANTVSYKALAFLSDLRSASFLFEVRAKGYSFDVETSRFNCKPSISEATIFRNQVERQLGRSHERRLGLKVLKTEEFAEERLIRSVNSDLEVKSIGRVIGGTARRARRTVTTNFNPRAWDGDNDGLIQEGTAFERPAIPGVNDFNTRGRVNVQAAVRAADMQGMGKRSERGNAKPSERVSAVDTARRSTTSAADITKPVTPRRGKPITAGARARRERALTGMASKKGPKKKTAAVPGIDKVSENDGAAWGQLNDAQKAVIKENLRLRRKEIEDQFRQSGWEDWLAGYLRKRDKKLPEFDFYNSSFDRETMSSLGYAIEAEIDAIDKDPDMDEKKKDTAKMRLQRLFDDLRTISNMQENDDYSLLEHLHPQSRKAAFGVRPKGDKWIPNDGKGRYASPLSDGQKAPKGILGNDNSTIFGRYGQMVEYVGEGKETTAGKAKIKRSTAKKLASASRRIFTPNPERQARRERRRARRAGQYVPAGEAIVGSKVTTRQRLRRARRAIQARLRGEETAGQIFARVEKREKHPLSIKGDEAGKRTLTVTDNWIKGIAVTAEEVARKKRGEKGLNDRSDKVQDVALLNMWQSMGHNGLPTLITEDQAKMLIADGYVHHNRGVGNNPAFVESYIGDEVDRFIPGIGGRAYGTGEYWAPPGSSHAWGYGNAQMIGFVSPEARVIKNSDLSRIVADGKKIEEAIRAFDVGMPDGEAEKLDPKEYIDQLMNYLKDKVPTDSALWNTELGQIYKQLLQRYSTSGGDEKLRAQLWGVLQYINKMFSHDSGYFAPLLGYDAISHGGDVTLVHNRAAMVVVDKPLTIDSGKQLVAEAKRNKQ